MSGMLDVHEISKRYGNKNVLKNVTFSVPEGEIVGFIGDNGAGKSTTFKIILGLVFPNTGSFKVLEKYFCVYGACIIDLGNTSFFLQAPWSAE